MRRLLPVLLLTLALGLPGSARAARDQLVIGITQFPSTFNPNIDAMAAKSYILGMAQRPFTSAIFLGSGGRFGAAREAALKMLEMTAGGIHTMAETFLGLRHGPMSAVHDDTLVVCFLSADPVSRAYEGDLIQELNQKSLGTHLLVGESLPDDLVRPTDAAIECKGLGIAGDDLGAVTDVVVGQLLAFFRCLALGLRPDAPSNNNVINRVVTEFTIHRRPVSS